MNLRRVILILTCAVMTSSLAQAHAFLDHAEPKVGSTVVSPAQVKIWMTKGVRGPYSTLQVFNAQEVEVDQKDVKVDNVAMTVSVGKLVPGTYTVKWKAEAQDCGHKTSGTFYFTVK